MRTSILKLLITLTLISTSNLAFAIPAAEREALIALYNSTEGDSWNNNTGWLGAVGTECGWFGVTCVDFDTGADIDNIVSIILSNNQLIGTIPSELGQLTKLNILALSMNQLTGDIPGEIGQLIQLYYLFLPDNQLTGGIPKEIGQLINLEYLSLYRNKLTGDIPKEIGQLILLQNFELFENQLTGIIPSELKNLINLKSLALFGNCLSTTDSELIDFLNGITSSWQLQNSDCASIVIDTPPPSDPILSTGSFAEPSDTAEQAIPILVSDEPQYHLLDNSGNEDWFEFYTIEGTNYTIEIPSDTTGSSINPVITLFDEQGNQLQTVDNNSTGQGEVLNWTATATGLFRIRISNQLAKARKAQTNALDYAYQIKVFLTDAPQQGLIKGFVKENCQGIGLAKAAVSAWAGTSLSDSTFTHKTGEFGIPLNPGNYDIISQANNYQDGSKNTNVEQVKTSQIQIDQLPMTDCSQTPVTVDPIIQQQQAVSSYDEKSGLLIIKDVWAGGNAYYVELQDIGNYNFVLADAMPLAGTIHTQPADYSFGTQLLNLPTVSALGNTYKVQMKSDANFVFTVTLVGEPD